jgi:hypothetical protein
MTTLPTLENITVALNGLQGLTGLGIVLGGFLILCMGSDKHTPWLTKAPVIGLVAWGAWFGGLALEGKHDSLAAIALAGLVAYVLLRYGRQVRGVLDRERWWITLAADTTRAEPLSREDRMEVHP